MEKLSALLKNTGDMALKRRANNIISNLDLKNGDKILDIGCGDGYYLHLLSNLGTFKLTGTDYDKSGLERAQKNLGKKIPLVQGDLMKKLPFKNNTFDKVVMSEVAEHLPNDLKGLKEVNRILKKDGILTITVPNHNYPLFWDPVNWVLEKTLGVHVKKGFFAGLWNQHERLYEEKQLKKLLEKSGFEIEIIKSLTWWCLPFNHYIVNLVARMLAGNSLPSNSKQALSKYTKNPKRGVLLDFAFKLVNAIDKLNDIYQPQERGVSVFAKATKK
jgi:ubiquinone/menaquinone biosynthesis C-methylase UbiE